MFRPLRCFLCCFNRLCNLSCHIDGSLCQSQCYAFVLAMTACEEQYRLWYVSRSPKARTICEVLDLDIVHPIEKRSWISNAWMRRYLRVPNSEFVCRLLYKGPGCGHLVAVPAMTKNFVIHKAAPAAAICGRKRDTAYVRAKTFGPTFWCSSWIKFSMYVRPDVSSKHKISIPSIEQGHICTSLSEFQLTCPELTVINLEKR